jgi:hypothetical protein
MITSMTLFDRGQDDKSESNEFCDDFLWPTRRSMLEQQ